jgi:microcystin-dependent protein
LLLKLKSLRVTLHRVVGLSAMGSSCRSHKTLPCRLGQEGGVETVTLSEAQNPSHNHTINAAANPAEAPGPGPSGGNALGRSVGGAFYATNTNPVPFNSATMQNTGGGQAHNNLQPFLAINFIIALQGIYPSRS